MSSSKTQIHQSALKLETCEFMASWKADLGNT